MQKRRPPIEQLRAAGKIAREMLVNRGIIAEKSILDKIIKDQGAPKLPGIPVYLPQRWTIQAAQRMMYDLLLMWKAKCGSDVDRLNNITEFFKFIITELRKQEKVFNKEHREMGKAIKDMKDVPLLKDVFSPLHKRDTARAIQRFFVDSFAVAIVLKNNHTTGDFANWFVTWTQELYLLWVKPEERDKIEIT